MTLNLLAAIGLLLADCSVYLDPTRWTIAAIMGLGFEILLLLNAFFSLTWLLTHRKMWSLISLLVVALSIPNILVTFSHSKPSTDLQKARAITVLTYNTQMMQMLKKAGKNDVLRYVKESGADVVCLQEYDVRKNNAYLTFDEAKRYLSGQYPYTYFDFVHFNGKRQYGIAVYSRYPLINKQTIHYESRSNISNYCDVVVEGDTIRLFNNHLESNRLLNTDLELSEEEMTSEGLKRSVGQVVKKLRAAYERRSPEVQHVRREIDQSPYPVIVVGDMNDGPVSYTYHHLSRGLQDAFLMGSMGKLGHTYRAHHLGIRIDYILSSPQFAVEYCVPENVPYSDHLPLTATLAW